MHKASCFRILYNFHERKKKVQRLQNERKPFELACLIKLNCVIVEESHYATFERMTYKGTFCCFPPTITALLFFISLRIVKMTKTVAEPIMFHFLFRLLYPLMYDNITLIVLFLV